MLSSFFFFLFFFLSLDFGCIALLTFSRYRPLWFETRKCIVVWCCY